MTEIFPTVKHKIIHLYLKTSVQSILFAFSTAQNVQLTDESFSSNDFKLIHGLLSTSWDRIPK